MFRTYDENSDFDKCKRKRMKLSDRIISIWNREDNDSR
jgi:hypothetical protein